MIVPSVNACNSSTLIWSIHGAVPFLICFSCPLISASVGGLSIGQWSSIDIIFTLSHRWALAPFPVGPVVHTYVRFSLPFFAPWKTCFHAYSRVLLLYVLQEIRCVLSLPFKFIHVLVPCISLILHYLVVSLDFPFLFLLSPIAVFLSSLHSFLLFLYLSVFQGQLFWCQILTYIPFFHFSHPIAYSKFLSFLPFPP